MAKRKEKKEIRKPLSVSSVNNVFKQSLEKDNGGNIVTQIEPEGIKNWRDTLIEMTKMVAIESERLALEKGSKRITARDVHDATLLFFGEREK